MSIMRIGGIASGFDTDQIVRDLMKVEQMKVDKLYQQRQVIDWQKEQLREIINNVRVFRDNYFNVLSPQNNMMSAAALKKMSAASSDTDVVTVAASSNAVIGTREIEIIQLATASRGTSSAQVTSSIESTADITAPVEVTDGKNVISVALNDVTKSITITAGTYNSLSDLQNELQNKIDKAFGSGKISVNLTHENKRLEIVPVSNLDTLVISSSSYYDGESSVDPEDILAVMNLETGARNRLSLSDTMETISSRLSNGPLSFDGEGKFTLTINSVEIEIDKTDTLRKVLNKIRNSSAGVTLTYSSFSDTLTIESKTTGEGTITFDTGGNFFTALNITAAQITDGQDVQFTVNGSGTASRSSNTFTVDGITYTAKAVGAATVTTALDTEGIYTTIESFVSAYNSLIDTINSKLDEERFRNYLPLTDEQKATMTDNDIELWEEKAKSGLLRQDSALENLLRDMRRALYDMVGSYNLTEIGIETSSNYQYRGKLVLKNGGSNLRTAIADNPDKVIEIFTKSSDIAYSPNLTYEQRTQRYNESGIAHRLSDILNDNIRITRNSNGQKGILLERAGMEGDITEFNNYYDRQVNDVNKRINRMNEILIRREEQYFRQFTAMEKALQQLYSQDDWLVTQMAQFNNYK